MHQSITFRLLAGALLALLTALPTDAQTLIPQPKTLVMGRGMCPVDKPVIYHKLKPMQGEPAEAYKLCVSPDSIIISASSDEGCTHARQTLAQLKTRSGYRVCTIDDYPTFRWRGAMIDVSRHFFPLDFLKKQIDAMARYKMNILHLHLTDSGGWRIETDRYPLLTQLGAWRTASDWDAWRRLGSTYATEGDSTAYGGYYTKEELRQLVSYAKAKGITIVPEVEMPGHSREVAASYPELQCRWDKFCIDKPQSDDLCPASEATVSFFENVLAEVMQVFPSEYIHVGGDEAGMDAWRQCELCQRKMKEMGMTDVKQLQAWFINRIDRYLAAHGRRLIGWDEIVGDSLLPSSAVMIWRDPATARKAISRGCPVVMSPSGYLYLDYYQDAPSKEPRAFGGYQTFNHVYGYDPSDGLSADELRHVLGVQGNLWTEYVSTPAHAEYMLYPRLLAIAETGWNGAAKPDAKTFRQRAEKETDRLRREGYNAFNLKREVGERPESLKPVKHKAVGAKVNYLKPYNDHYKAQGPTTLTDGQQGGWTYGDRKWQGFIGQDCFDVVVDLGSEQPVHSISLTFMQHDGADVFLPKTLYIEASTDGKSYQQVSTIKNERISSERTRYIPYVCRKSIRARYLHIKAQPEPGMWIFTDEIIVK